MRALKSFLTAAVFAVGVLPASAQVPQVDAFYAFGDSLADSGNIFVATQQLGFNPPIPPPQTYFLGRFSNGLNAFDQLWIALGHNAPGLLPSLAAPPLDGTDAVSFAIGGSGTGFVNDAPGGFEVVGLKGQVGLFATALRGQRPSSNALFGIISGANDYIRRHPLQPKEVVDNIGESIQALYSLGARNVIMVNLLDLGKIPIACSELPDIPASARLTNLSRRHNRLLAEKLTELTELLPDLNIIAPDVNALLPELPGCGQLPAALDALFPQVPGASLCIFVNPGGCPDARAYFNNFDLPFVFWDTEHPTTAAHRVLAEYLLTQLKD